MQATLSRCTYIARMASPPGMMLLVAIDVVGGGGGGGGLDGCAYRPPKIISFFGCAESC